MLDLDLDLGRVLDLYGDCPKGLICRHEACKREVLHEAHVVRRKAGEGFRTRSKYHLDHPWQAQSAEALREAVYNAVSSTEPRNFQVIVHEVRNDYGSCLERSVHRHLKSLRESKKIVRLEWHRVYAYLRSGSKLLSEPALVFEQILSTRAT